MYYLYDHNHNLIKLDNAQEIISFLKPVKHRAGREVYCWNNRTLYKSIKDAATILHLDKGQLGNHLRRVKSYKEVKGMVFSFTDSEEYLNKC